MEQLLRIATMAAAALLLAGLLMPYETAATRVLHAGLWLLIVTPIVRVLMALAGYVKDRDWRFTGLTVVVLLSLVLPLAMYFLSPR